MDVSKITVNAQNSIRIDAGKIIYLDPFEIKEAKKDADYIFITHDHYDHFSPESIEKIAKPDTVFIAPQPMEKQVKKIASAENIISVFPDNTYETTDFSFETVKAYNVMKPFHSKNAGWVGYILLIEGERIYIAGDTDVNEDIQKVKCDTAFIPIGGFYTMNYKDAAKLINMIRPKLAIPTHYGKVVGKPTDGEDFKKLVDSDIRVEIKL